MKKPSRKAKDFRGTVRRLLRYLKPEWPKLAAVFCFAAASTWFTVRAPKIAGDAVNQLTDGFIAKSTVNAVDKIQKKADPAVRSMLGKLETARKEAARKADTTVETEFKKQMDAQKQKAYADAEKTAGEAVEKKFQQEVRQKKQQVLSEAEKVADEAALEQFRKAVDQKRNQAYASAAEAADLAAEREFQKTLDSKRLEAYGKARAAADSMAEAEFQKEVDARKQEALAKARDDADKAVEKEFQRQVSLKKRQALSSAKKEAKKAVRQKFSEIVSSKKREAYAKAKTAADEAVEAEFQKQLEDRKQKAYADAVAAVDMLDAPPAVRKAAEEKAKAEVDEEFRKQKPYFDAQLEQAKEQAEETARSKVDEEISKRAGDLQRELEKAEEQAEKQVSDAVNAEFQKQKPALEEKLAQGKKAAEEKARGKVEEELKKQQPDLTKKLREIKKSAEEKAMAQVDEELKKQQPDLAKKLAEIKKMAEGKAKSKVDAEFGKQKPALDARLADAKKMAEEKALKMAESGFADQKDRISALRKAAETKASEKARAAVDTEFRKQKPALDARLADAKSQAEEKVRDAVEKAALKEAGATESQMKALREVASIPYLGEISGSRQKADAVDKIFGLLEQLPPKYAEKLPTVSKSNLDKGAGDVRKYGGTIPFDEIGKTLRKLILAFAFSAVCMFLTHYLMSGVAQRTVNILRGEVDDKLSRLPLRFFDSHATGDILSRMTNDIDTISSTLQQSLTQIVISAFQIIGYTWMMFSINTVLTLIVLATLPLYLLSSASILGRSQKYYSSQQKNLGKLSGHTEEMFSGHTVVKAYGLERKSIQKFQNMNQSLYESARRAQFLSGILMPLMNFVGNVGYVLIAVIGGIFVTKDYINLGDIVSFVSYSKMFSQPMVMTANIANVIQSAVACAERVFEVLDEKEEKPDPEDAVSLENPEGNIRFIHVRFRYLEDVPLIEDMNLDVRQGDTVAIVGPTGAGKTTLVNLLMRFYEISGGKITFDGVDIRRIRRGNLRTMFGMVLQDTWLFHGTIRENIAYGREDASDEEIERAAKAAYADHFIRSLPDGYDTVLNTDASNLSQGQRQLLTIARAILADPAVLILDEATSSVDTRTEVLIQKAMGVLMKGRTNFVIAHRLSTVRDAKMILVMVHGAIVEKGTHRSLLQKGGFYAKLYNSQFAGKEI